MESAPIFVLTNLISSIPMKSEKEEHLRNRGSPYRNDPHWDNRLVYGSPIIIRLNARSSILLRLQNPRSTVPWVSRVAPVGWGDVDDTLAVRVPCPGLRVMGGCVGPFSRLQHWPIASHLAADRRNMFEHILANSVIGLIQAATAFLRPSPECELHCNQPWWRGRYQLLTTVFLRHREKGLRDIQQARREKDTLTKSKGRNWPQWV